MKILIWILFFFLPPTLFGQKPNSDTNFIFWSKNIRLQPKDFQIKVPHVENLSSYGQFTIDYTINGGFGLLKDYKKKIRNYFIKSASWLDTTYNVHTSIQHQQTLFDLAEVYVRQYRQLIYQNRKKLMWGTIKIDKINAEVMTNFSRRRAQYEIATNFGTIADKQLEWESAIARELNELGKFSADDK